MDRRNPRLSTGDDLAVTKAAAWAWYQRGSGSGSEGRPMSEYGLKRIERSPQPSRYKIESTRAAPQQPPPPPLPLSPIHSDSSDSHLLDRYEIERISRQLDGYIEASSERSEVVVVKREKKGIKSTKPKGFWLMRHGVVACGGSRDDVVEFARRGFRERRPPPPEKGGGVVVGAANGRRRTTRAAN